MSVEPTKLPVLCESSDKNTLNASTPSGFFAIATGFGVINAIRRISGGIPPKREDFNMLFNIISKPIAWFCKGGYFVWDSAIAADTGYPIGARVRKVGAAGLWVNLVDNNATNPDTGGANWGSDDAGAVVVTNSAKWDNMPIGYSQPFYPLKMGGDDANITAWLAVHTSYEKVDNSIISGIEGRAMAVASGTHAAGTQEGSDDAVVIAHGHGITEPNAGNGHLHGITNTSFQAEGNGYVASGNGGAEAVSPTDYATTGITINSSGEPGTNKNIQRTQYLDWIIKVS